MNDHLHCVMCDQTIVGQEAWYIEFETAPPIGYEKSGLTKEQRLGPYCHKHATQFYRIICGKDTLPLPRPMPIR